MAVDVEYFLPKKTKLEQFRASQSLILVTVCIAIFNDVFLFGTIIPILPYALPHRVTISPDAVQIWIAVLLAAYGGALLLGSLVFGWLGDRLPQRRGIFLFGLVCLLLATVLLAVGRHIVLLIIGRFLQGLAAAVVWTSGLAMLADIFGKERYGEAIGYGQSSVSIGTTSSPLLGGLVYSRGGYSAVSAMSIGTVALSLALGLLMVEPKPEPGPESVPETAPINKGLDGLSVDSSSTECGSDPSTANEYDPDERSALIPKFVNIKKPNHKPAYPLLLRSGRVLAAMGGIFTFAFVLISFEGIIPLFVKETFHWNSIHAALIFLTWIIPGMLGPIAGKTADRFGSRWVAVGGFLFTVAPLVLMRLVTRDTTTQKVLLCSLLTLVGLGLVWVPASCISDLSAAAADLKHQRPKEFGDSGALTQAFGLFVFAYSCGVFVGPTISGVMKAKLDWGAATLVLAIACTVACIPIGLKTSASSRKRSVPMQ